MYRIPFNKPSVEGDEFAYVQDVLRSGHLSGDGPYTRKCHAFLEEHLGVAKAFLTTSCTHALEMAALLLDIGPDDDVVVPAFTFVSTVNAFVLRGARPVFADIRRDTLNIDEAGLERLLTRRTRAIVVVHYAGVGCEMDRITQIAGSRGIAIIEDNAHGLFGAHKGRLLGTFGAMATQSFHETKNLSCGEGGALLVNDARYVERAEIIREKGTNRSRFFRGQVDKYTWVDVGSSYLPSEILAAVLYAQMERYLQIQAKRRRVWTYYMEHLTDWAATHGVQLPVVPPGCEQSYHMFYMLLPSQDHRATLIAHLKARGILSVFHYLPLHLSPMGARMGGKAGNCPVTEWASERLVRLPFFNGLTPEEQEDVVAAVRSAPLTP